MDKMREEFEAWYSDFDGYGEAHKKELWDTWKASRSALCIELPSKRNGWDICRNTFMDGRMCGFNDGVDQCAEAISAVGASYK